MLQNDFLQVAHLIGEREITDTCWLDYFNHLIESHAPLGSRARELAAVGIYWKVKKSYVQFLCP